MLVPCPSGALVMCNKIQVEDYLASARYARGRVRGLRPHAVAHAAGMTQLKPASGLASGSGRLVVSGRAMAPRVGGGALPVPRLGGPPESPRIQCRDRRACRRLLIGGIGRSSSARRDLTSSDSASETRTSCAGGRGPAPCVGGGPVVGRRRGS
jgi:hypothetical protein